MAHFDQPHHLTTRTANERKLWWDRCKRLEVDSLLCLVDSDGESLFFSVCEREGYKEKDTAEPQDRDPLFLHTAVEEQRAKPNLFANPYRATITLPLIDVDTQEFFRVVGRDITLLNTRQILVEFPRCYYPRSSQL